MSDPDLYVEFRVALSKALGARPPGVRKGQVAFNLLHDMYPNVANRIRSTDRDPFHRDDLIPHFLQEVQRQLGGDVECSLCHGIGSYPKFTRQVCGECDGKGMVGAS